MEQKKSVKKNYVYNVLYQMFMIIVPLLTTPYVSRTLGPDGVGQYSFTYSLINYFTVFGCLGFNIYAQREIAKNQMDKHKQSVTFHEVNICRLIPVTISLLINVVLCLTGVYNSYTTLMSIFTINIIAVAFDISYYFQGNEEFGKLVFRNFIVKLLSVISIFLFVKTKEDVYIYVLINATSVIFGALVMWVAVPKMIEKVKISELKPLKHLVGTLILFLPTIATSIYTLLDKTLIGFLIPDTYTVQEPVYENGILVTYKEVIKKYSDLENGYYEQADKLVKLSLTFITAIGTVMVPRNTHEIACGNIDGVKKNLSTASKLVMMIGVPMTLGIIAVSSNIVPWFFGAGFDKVIILLRVLSPLIIIIGYSNVLGFQYMVPAGYDKRFTLALFIGSISNLVLNLVFIRFYWSIGAAIATLIAESAVTFTMSMMCLKEVNIYKEMLKCYKYYIGGIAMFAACYYLSTILPATFYYTALIIFVGIVIYGLVLLILRDKYLYLGLNKVLSKLKKNKE